MSQKDTKRDPGIGSLFLGRIFEPFSGHSYINFCKWPGIGPEMAEKKAGNDSKMARKWPGKSYKMSKWINLASILHPYWNASNRDFMLF